MKRTFLVAAIALFCVPAMVSASTCPVLARGATGSAVTTLQEFLNYEYANFPTPTGYFGVITQEAVQQWQFDHGIVTSGTPATTGYGTVGPKTAAAMGLSCSSDSIAPMSQSSSNPVSASSTQSLTSSSVVSPGMSGNTVVVIQQFLIVQGLLPAGDATGYFGALTEAAVQKFQVQEGIVSNGTPATTGYGAVGPRTVAAMLAAASTPNVSKTSPTLSGSVTLTPPSFIVTQPQSTVTQPITSITGGSVGAGSGTIATSPPPPASCTFNGSTVANSSSVTAYQSSSGTSCVPQTRTCTNGTLSGSYQYASCSTVAGSCSLSGETVVNGLSEYFYSATSVPSGSFCSSISQQRTCFGGVLTGDSSYQYASCAVAAAAASCTFNGQTIVDGSSVTAYQSSSVPTGSQCVAQQRTCSNGTLSGSYSNAACIVAAAPVNVPASLAGSLMPIMKNYGCTWDGLLWDGPDEIWHGGLGNFNDYVAVLGRSGCRFLSRSIEDWDSPPNFSTVQQRMSQIESATGKSYIYSLNIAEAIPCTGSYLDPITGQTLDFSKMVVSNDPSGSYYGGATCVPSFHNPEYLTYVTSITEQAINIGVQDFLFGNMDLQESQQLVRTNGVFVAGRSADTSWQTAPVFPQIFAQMRAYAYSKGKQIAIGCQLPSPPAINGYAYLHYCDYKYVPLLTGNFNEWGNTSETSQTNIIADFEWWGENSGSSDDIITIAKMSQPDRDSFVFGKMSYFRGQLQGAAGLLLPYIEPIQTQQNITGAAYCHGPGSADATQSNFSPSNNYCQDEDVFADALAGLHIYINADQHYVPYGGSTTLRWSTPTPDTCTVYDGTYALWLNSTYGDTSTYGPLKSDTTYILKCPDGEQAQTTVQVTGGPTSFSGGSAGLANALTALESALQGFLQDLK